MAVHEPKWFPWKQLRINRHLDLYEILTVIHSGSLSSMQIMLVVMDRSCWRIQHFLNVGNLDIHLALRKPYLFLMRCLQQS